MSSTQTSTETLPQSPAEAQLAALPTVPGYEVLALLGKGGMGVVYKAREVELDRLVALKMIALGALASPEHLARFRREAEAVAHIQHANVVHIHAIGQHNGQPYLALEFVAGGSLAQKLSGAPQPPRQAAQLLQTLATAMHDVHRVGIVHRDLKPGNILLTADGTPKITDFGLAKQLTQESEAPAALAGQTQSGAILGTPSYMAPEQAAGQTKDIGPPADIFALGVILYEMLTGRPPFQASTPMETIMRVLALDPVPPRKLQRRVPRDLETICLKCLQKEPAKRYATAQALAEDCGAFLRGEPIQARPMPLWEQAVSWARRRPAWAALGGTSAVAVLVVMVVVLLSNASLQEQRRIADEKRQEAEAQRSRAVRHLRKACDAVDLMLSRVGFERLADVPAVAPIQRELLEDALHFYQELAQQEAADPELRHELGRAHRRLGKLYQSLGELEKAEQSFRAALAVHAPMVEEAPSVPEYRRELASSHNNLGLLLGGRNQPEKAEQELRLALDLQEKLVADFPDEPNYLLELSQSYDNLGMILDPLHRDQEAEQALRHAGELAEQLLAKHPGVPEHESHRANNNMNLGVYLARRKRLGEAEIAFRRDVDLWAKLAEASPESARLRARLALGCYNLGNLLAETKQPQEAEKFLRRSVELRKRLTEEFPAVPDYRAALADTLHKVAQLLRTSDVPAAAALWEQAVEQQQAILKVNPDSAEKRRALFLFRWNLADARVRLGQHRTAAQTAAELLPISPDNYEDCYHATRLFARCAVLAEKDTTLSEEERKTLAQQYAGQAVQALREAVRRGYFDFRYIQDDHSLDVLRSRDDFQQLLAGLRNKPR